MIFAWLARLLNRFQALKHTRLEGEGALLLFDKRVRFILEPGSEIIVRNGQLRLGYALPGATPYASHPETIIHIQRGGRWVCDGSVAIAPGANIKIGPGAVLEIGSDTLIAQNLMLICNYRVHIGRFCHFSWNVTLIDDDGHRYVRPNGESSRRLSKPLLIGDQVGLHMNVQIPSAVTIEDRATVGAGTVLRQDLPAECIAYADSKIKIHEGFTFASKLAGLEAAL